MGALLKETDVATLARMAPRSVRRRACELRAEPADAPSPNGKRGRLYHLASLSPALQQEFLDRQRELEANAPQSALDLALTLPAGTNLSEADREEAVRRYRVIEPFIVPEAFRALWFEHRGRKSKLIESIAANNKLSRRVVYGWLKAWKKEGLPGLVTRGRADKGRSRALNPAALDFILAGALPCPGTYGELSIREIFRAYSEERTWRAAHAQVKLGEFERRKYARYLGENERLLPAAQLSEASYETFRRWYGRIPEAVKAHARRGEQSFFNEHEILSYRDLESIKPLDFLVCDDRMLDLFCLVPVRGGWRLVRPWLSAAIDMRTRRWLSWVLVETPSSESIASVLKTVFMQFGVPRACYWDNGKSYRCAWLEGRQERRSESPRIAELGDGMRGVLETLGIRVHHAIVRRARSKIVEPAFVNIANWEKTLPEYSGNRPDARPEQFDKLIDQHEKWLKGEAPATPFRTIDEIAGLYAELMETLNEREHTSGAGMQKLTATGYGWMSSNECWEALIGGVERRTVSAEVLQWCFTKRRQVRVLHGEAKVSFYGRPYRYRLLDSPIQLVGLNGREVVVAFDPLDLETVALYLEGRFLGFAANAELRRMGEKAFVEDEKLRRRTRREVNNYIDAVHQSIPMATPEERAARRMAVRPARPLTAPSGTEVAVPSEIIETVAAARKDREFSFAATGADLIRAADNASCRDDDEDDGEFEMFVRREGQ